METGRRFLAQIFPERKKSTPNLYFHGLEQRIDIPPIPLFSSSTIDEINQALVKAQVCDSLDHLLNPRKNNESKSNIYKKVGVFVDNHLHFKKLQESGHKPQVLAGQGVGFYNACVAAGIISLADAISLIVAEKPDDSFVNLLGTIEASDPQVPVIDQSGEVIQTKDAARCAILQQVTNKGDEKKIRKALRSFGVATPMEVGLVVDPMRQNAMVAAILGVSMIGGSILAYYIFNKRQSRSRVS